jgi:hypothetical protein
MAGLGFGYGLAMLGNQIAPAQLRGRRHEEEHQLKERQMDVNEAAERRAGEFYGEINQDRRLQRKKSEFDAEAIVKAEELMHGGTQKGATGGNAPAPEAASPDVTNAEPTSSLAPEPEAPQVDVLGNELIPDGSGGWMTAQGTPSEPLTPGVGRSGAPRSATVTPGGQKGGMPVKTGGALPKAAPSGYGVPAPQAQPATASAKDETLLRQGKSQVAPAEVQGYQTQYETLSANADGVETRLQEALKSVDQRYSNDPTMATYLKANIIAKVRPQIEQMKTNAARLKQEGQLAQFAHDAGGFAESMLAHIEGGGKIDQKWIDANKDVAAKLGIQPGMLWGLHKNDQGAIVNGQGYVYPRGALMKMANAALPWKERFDAMKDVDSMYKVQQELAIQRQRVAQADPLRVEKWTLGMVRANDQNYAANDYAYSKAKELFAKGTEKGKPITVNIGGKPVQVDIPPQYKDGEDWLYGMSKSQDPKVQAAYEQIILPLERARAQADTIGQFLGGFRARVKVANEATGERAAEAAEQRSYGMAKGRSEAEADIAEERRSKLNAK